MKKTFALLIIIVVFFTACQPTPEELIVKSKVDDTYNDKISKANEKQLDEASIQEEKLAEVIVDITHIKKEIAAKGDNLHISIDADVYTPQAC